MDILKYYKEKWDLADSAKHEHIYDYSSLPINEENKLLTSLEKLDKEYGFEKTDIRNEEHLILVKCINNYLRDHEDDDEEW